MAKAAASYAEDRQFDSDYSYMTKVKLEFTILEEKVPLPMCDSGS